MRLIILAWVAAPRQVLFPPQTLRFTTAGRIACSARQFVASTPSLCEEGEQGLFLGVEVLCELAVLVVGLSVVGEHRDALCEVGHDGLSLLFAEIPGIEGLDEDLPGPCAEWIVPHGGQVGDQLVTST